MKAFTRYQTGLSLVELMVAMTLSLVLLAGVLLVFSANKTTYRMQSGLGTLQENGRYAIRQIAADLQMAGFGGCLSPHLDPRPRVINLVSSAPPYLDDFAAGEFFAGRNDEPGTFSYGGKAMLPGTDSIEIRGPLRSNVSYVAGETPSTGTVDVLGTANGFAVNEYLMISDCAGADIFRATGVTTSGGNTQVGHGSGANSQATLSRKYSADAVLMAFVTHTYFVADTGRSNAAGQAISGLFRFDGASAQELVDGVEDMQIEYALDTDGDLVIDAFRDAGGMTAANWGEVMAIRISLLMNSVEGASAVVAPYTYYPVSSQPIVPPSGDYRLRQEFSSLVSVRNAVF